mmetsp:Transcript_16715/g.20417  ORF Transcript_16715/g.20417 Transcript_16715/m.20417 type:complete len:473 (-) Transcript_16715:208-1626(-)
MVHKTLHYSIFLLFTTLVMSSFGALFSSSRGKITRMISAKSAAAFVTPFSSQQRSIMLQNNKSYNVFHTSNENKEIGKSFLVLRSDNEKDYSSSSSWRDKNNEFSQYDSEPSPFQQSISSSKRGNKQRRRRNDRRTEDFNTKRDQEQQSFRDNFRGTRVFVQGLPDSVNWQELKDHFKVAGDVVFASVSIDRSTGQSKGCGVVQFETTDMAKNAIQIMRNHPFDDGSVLYVREDFQEEDSSKSLRNSEKRGSTPSSSLWRCADEDASSVFSTSSDLLMVENLIKARDQARRRRNYETSDNIREDLKQRFGVHLDDRLKLWWVSTDNVVPTSVQNIKGDGRWGDAKPWRQIPTTIENDACVSNDLVNGLLKQRDIARREKDFKTADRLLEEARCAPDGELYLRIHDESRTWRIWTTERPPSTTKRVELSPAEQCIALVEKRDPDKIEEVKNLLQKFPGREYNILKRLKQNYDL